MANVFVSHSSLDQDFAEQFASELRKHAHRPVGDVQGLRISPHWDKELLDALAKADVVVFLFTKHASGSENILAEVGSAKMLFSLVKKPHLIPVVFPGGSLPEPLSRVWAQMLTTYPNPMELAVLVNSLITALPNSTRGTLEHLSLPEKVTFPWLREFVPVVYWWALLGVLMSLILGTFTFGLKSARIPWVADLFGEKSSLLATSATSQTCENVTDAVQAAVGVIREPSPKRIVPSKFPASGMASIAQKCVSLWLAVEVNGSIWPRTEGQLPVDKVGVWNQPVIEQGHPADFSLSLWASNPTTDIQLHGYLGRGQNVFSYAELRQMGMKRLDIVQGLQLAKQ